MPEKKIQAYLFQRIKELLPPDASLVDTVAAVLYLSQDSAYRRIRGETPLVLEEAKLLCEQFHISLDQLLTLNERSVVFENSALNTTATDFDTYLKGIFHELQKLDRHEQKNIVYITSDLPFFYQFFYQSLFAFRYFFWMKSTIEHPDFSRRKFSLDCLPRETEALGKNVISLYTKSSSTEILNTECINGTLSQIAYYYEAGFISKDDAVQVYDSLKKTIQHLQLQAEFGAKYLPHEQPQMRKQNFRLFHNRTGLGDNLILTQFDGRRKLYLNYDALSYMATEGEAFCAMVDQQLDSIMRRSTLISNVSEKQRNIFFNAVYDKIPFYLTPKVKTV